MDYIALGSQRVRHNWASLSHREEGPSDLDFEQEANVYYIERGACVTMA